MRLLPRPTTPRLTTAEAEGPLGGWAALGCSEPEAPPEKLPAAQHNAQCEHHSCEPALQMSMSKNGMLHAGKPCLCLADPLQLQRLDIMTRARTVEQVLQFKM